MKPKSETCIHRDVCYYLEDYGPMAECETCKYDKGINTNIQHLLNSIIHAKLIVYPVHNGRSLFECPFCDAMKSFEYPPEKPDMTIFDHDDDCIYRQAMEILGEEEK